MGSRTLRRLAAPAQTELCGQPGHHGRIVPLHWVEDLDWKAYAIVWRLHVIDHLKQAKKVLAALER